MLRQTHFVIFRSDSRYSITECSSSGVKQAYMTDGVVSGDGSVVQRLSNSKPIDISIQNFLESHAGHLIFEQR